MTEYAFSIMQIYANKLSINKFCSKEDADMMRRVVVSIFHNPISC